MFEVALGPNEKWPTLAPRTVLLAHATFPANRFDAEQFLNLLTAERLDENKIQQIMLRAN